MPRRAPIALVAIALVLGLIAAGPAAARPFAPTSVWNAAVPADAPRAATSSKLVGNLLRQVSTYGSWINTWQYSVPVYTVPAGQPAVHVTLDVAMPELQADFDAVPLPPGAKPAPGTDAHLTVYEPATDTLWDFWKLVHRADGWHARWGGKLTGVSRSPGYWPNGFGATATSLPLLGGLMRASELQAGRIDHALALGLPETKAQTWVWPAQRTDGTSTAADAIPEGTRLRLDPTLDVAALGLPPVTQAMALAAQRYGVVVRDVSGSVSFYGEDPGALPSNPYTSIFGGHDPAQLLARFPWSRLQVLAPPAAASRVAAPARRRRTGL
jgi:hypothetical protein